MKYRTNWLSFLGKLQIHVFFFLFFFNWYKTKKKLKQTSLLTGFDSLFIQLHELI